MYIYIYINNNNNNINSCCCLNVLLFDCIVLYLRVYEYVLCMKHIYICYKLVCNIFYEECLTVILLFSS